MARAVPAPTEIGRPHLAVGAARRPREGRGRHGSDEAGHGGGEASRTVPEGCHHPCPSARHWALTGPRGAPCPHVATPKPKPSACGLGGTSATWPHCEIPHALEAKTGSRGQPQDFPNPALPLCGD